MGLQTVIHKKLSTVRDIEIKIVLLDDTPALYPALSQGRRAGNPHGYWLKLSTALPFTLPPLLLRVALRLAF